MKVRFYVAVDINNVDSLEHAYRRLRAHMNGDGAPLHPNWETQDEFQITHPTLGHSEGDPEELHLVIGTVTQEPLYHNVNGKMVRKERT